MDKKKEIIKVTANKKNKTFTIRKIDLKGKCFAKYRTEKLSKEEFNNFDLMTENDWRNYLVRSNSYIIIK